VITIANYFDNSATIISQEAMMDHVADSFCLDKLDLNLLCSRWSSLYWV